MWPVPLPSTHWSVSLDLEPASDSHVPSGGGLIYSEFAPMVCRVWSLLVAAIKCAHQWKIKNKNVRWHPFGFCTLGRFSNWTLWFPGKQGPAGTQVHSQGVLMTSGTRKAASKTRLVFGQNQNQLIESCSFSVKKATGYASPIPSFPPSSLPSFLPSFS